MATLTCFSQSQVEFEKFSSQNGISQSITYAIDKDSLGNLWIATEEGVVKFNSNNNQLYNKYKGLPEKVGNRVRTIFIDSKERIWAGTEKGVCLYNPMMDTFNFSGNTITTGPTLVKDITEDLSGNILVGAFNGLWILDSKSLDNLFLKISTVANVQAILPDGDKIIVGTANGLKVFDLKTNSLNELSETFQSLNVTFIKKREVYS